MVYFGTDANSEGRSQEFRAVVSHGAFPPTMFTSLLALRAKPRFSLPAVHQTVRTVVKGPPKDANVSDVFLSTLTTSIVALTS